MRLFDPDDDEPTPPADAERIRDELRRPAPGKRHRRAHDTEALAASEIVVKTGTQREAVLLCLARHAAGMTDDEIANDTGLYLYSAAPRRTELLDGKLVEDSGVRRLSGRGKPAIVWQLTERGRAVAAAR